MSLNHGKCLLVLGWVWLCIILPSHTMRAEPAVKGVRHWSSPFSTRVVLDLSEQVRFRTFTLPGPPRLVTDMEEVWLSNSPLLIPINSNVLHQIRMARHSPRVVRLVLDLRKAGLQHNAFLLPPMHGFLFRLVIDVESPQMARRMKEERQAVKKEKMGKAYVVVIDPGHGGEDPGAVGPRGTKEKDVVLSIAKYLQKRLNRKPGIRAFLTRTGDYYVGLMKRVEIAQDYGVDLFLSIHADAARSRRSRGASVYCLSLKGATDEAARVLAERENASDSRGGLSLGGDLDVNTILLDLMQTQTANTSLGWGKAVLQELKTVQQLKFTAPRQAGFRVLKAPNFPSVLVEVGYISNPKDEYLLRTSAFRKGLAAALETSTSRFLCQQRPIRRDQLELGFCQETRPLTHVVKRGQNLFQIALSHNSSVTKIQRTNEIKDPSRIYPGQKLLIP